MLPYLVESWQLKKERESKPKMKRSEASKGILRSQKKIGHETHSKKIRHILKERKTKHYKRERAKTHKELIASLISGKQNILNPFLKLLLLGQKEVQRTKSVCISHSH